MKRLLITSLYLLAAVLLWQCGEEPAQSLSPEMTAELSRMPESADGLAYANVEKMRNSPFYEMIMDSVDAEINDDRQFREFVDATGFDLRKDIDEVYLAMQTAPAVRRPNFVVVGIGDFSGEKIMDFIRERDDREQLAEESYEGFTLYTTRGEGPDEGPALCFADDRHAVAGHKGYVKAWLDSYRSGTNNSGAWKPLLETVKYKNGAWFTLNARDMVGDLLNDLADRSPAADRLEALKSIEKMQMSVNVNNAIDMDGQGIFSDAQSAKLFHDVMKGFLATAKLSMSSDRQAVDVVNKINLKTDDKTIRVDFQMTRDDIKKLMHHHRRYAAH